MSFDEVRALSGVSLRISEGEIVGLIGPNGAGKTTMLDVLSGFRRASSGHVRVGERLADSWRPQQFARAGVARTFQNLRLFSALSLRENVQVAALGVGASGRDARRRADDLLRSLSLEAKAADTAHSLSYGEEKVLAVGRALAGYPRILLLDEPAAGLNESETDWIRDVIARVRDWLGCGILVVEHDMRLIMSLCERVHVLNFGRTICEGTPDEVQCDSSVQDAYLGAAR